MQHSIHLCAVHSHVCSEVSEADMDRSLLYLLACYIFSGREIMINPRLTGGGV